jgi:hypothetical protein
MWTTIERRTTISLSPPSAPRLRLRPKASPEAARTALDGAWWPRSSAPAAELPGLILGLQDHGPIDDHRPITHVLLRVDDWDDRPRRLRVDGPAGTRVVRLSWFESLPAGLLTAIHADGRRVDLLTVPPSTGRAEAEAAMELASHPANHLHTPGLLAALTAPPEAGHDDAQADSESAWRSESGPLRANLAARSDGERKSS